MAADFGDWGIVVLVTAIVCGGLPRAGGQYGCLHHLAPPVAPPLKVSSEQSGPLAPALAQGEGAARACRALNENWWSAMTPLAVARARGHTEVVSALQAAAERQREKRAKGTVGGHAEDVDDY